MLILGCALRSHAFWSSLATFFNGPLNAPDVIKIEQEEIAVSRRRVVVTGMGMLSPLGNDVPSSWQGILAGRSGIGLIEHMDLSA